MRIELVFLGLFLAGCASFGYIPARVSYDREDLAKIEKAAIFEYAKTEGYVTALCELKQLPEERCAQAAQTGQRMRALYASWKAAPVEAPGLTPEQLAVLRQLGGQLFSLAARAGLSTTGLGGLGGLLGAP